jgi:SAM-dependent methyltransferase
MKGIMKMDLKESDSLGKDIDQHWYYRAKAKLIQKLLPVQPCQNVLDIGAGSGFFSKYLLEHGHVNLAYCQDPNYNSDTDHKIHDKVLLFRRSLPEHSDFDLILLMDVLEHVDNDIILLEGCMQYANPGALFMITVPAFQWLWSNHDVFLGHQRRYSLSLLESRVQEGGLSIVQSGYCYLSVLPIAIITRLAQKLYRKQAGTQLKRHHFLTNLFLYTLCLLEWPFLKYNRLAGLTVYCLARKQH